MFTFELGQETCEAKTSLLEILPVSQSKSGGDIVETG